MKKYSLIFLLSLICWVAQAQSMLAPVVPNNIYFADMHLEIQESGQREIQKMVDALLKHPGYFQKKVELADAYFPLIEKTFLQEGLPTDFKYLALQESGLVSDAVSTSNAVGFWQFKEASATELGVRVNNMVDERKHIIESSRGAAKYMIRSNAYYKNWFNSLLSYYQGLTGTKALTKTSDIGVKRMQVDDKTNKYLLTFLAHKVAYENFVGKNPKPPITLQALKANPGQSLSEIAMATKVAAEEVERYNKWLLASTVPADKDYFVLIPSLTNSPSPVLAQTSTLDSKGSFFKKLTGHESKDELKEIAANRKAQLTTVNDLHAIIAQVGDTKDMLALQAGISTRKFLKYNDLRSFDEIVPGRTYYTQAKHSIAYSEYHVARSGESMHDVSQKYGVRLSKLLRMNRMKKNEALLEGRVVWLQMTRPSSTPIEYQHPQEEVVPQTTEVLVQQPATAPAAPATVSTPVQPAPAKPVAASTTTTVVPAPTTTTAPTATAATAPVTSTTTAAPVKPRAGAISIEVDDPNYVSSSASSIEQTYGTAAGTSTGTNSATLSSATSATPSTSTEATFTTAAPTATEHVVQQGETLYALSKQYHVSIDTLQAWNGLNGGALTIGQKLSLNGPAAGVTSIASVATPTTPAAASMSGIHTVVPGETIYGISKKYGVSIQDLQQWNNLTTGLGISVGQTLTVKAPAAVTETNVAPVSTTLTAPTTAPTQTTGNTVTHRVATGESMYQISRQYGVTIKEIMEWNNKQDFTVSIGESLIIKPKK